MLKKLFTQAATFIKELVAHLWDATDSIEIPSASDWKMLTDFEAMTKHSLFETVLALGAVLGVTIFSWVRFLINTSFMVSAFVVIQLLVIYKALTFWRKVK